MALDDHRTQPPPPNGFRKTSDSSSRDETRKYQQGCGTSLAGGPHGCETVADPAMDSATRALRDREPPNTQRLIDLVTSSVRHETRLGPLLPLNDPTCTLQITERAASAALRRAADEVPGVTTASCRLARADLSTGVHVSMTVTVGLDRPLPETAGLVRRSVVDTSGQTLGMAVTAVDIVVIDAHHTSV
ncbi:Asp23/Gls24 family envelope stress response protein [Streptomyces sp. NPDC005195]|uniref:Asp23/Gls24 family envelope stress response protein n=1 Tax=Streptomyces sp. NPDC005195 TaxID=3154561 RepID=UPI0033AC1391